MTLAATMDNDWASYISAIIATPSTGDSRVTSRIRPFVFCSAAMTPTRVFAHSGGIDVCTQGPAVLLLGGTGEHMSAPRGQTLRAPADCS